MHAIRDVLPYLAGIASGFVLQFLVQVYLVPRTESRRRRDERWERDVIDLGDLLTGPLSTAARQARAEQAMLRAMRDFPRPTMGADPKRDERERQIWEQRQKTRDATDVFTELVSSRANWVADKVIEFGKESPAIVPFVQAAYLYRLHVLALPAHVTDELSSVDLRATWNEEQDRRLKLIDQVKALAALRHAPRKSMRWRLRRLRGGTASLALLTRYHKKEPAPDPGTVSSANRTG